MYRDFCFLTNKISRFQEVVVLPAVVPEVVPRADRKLLLNPIVTPVFSSPVAPRKICSSQRTWLLETRSTARSELLSRLLLREMLLLSRLNIVFGILSGETCYPDCVGSTRCRIFFWHSLGGFIGVSLLPVFLVGWIRSIWSLDQKFFIWVLVWFMTIFLAQLETSNWQPLASGTSVSHVADLVGPTGTVYAVEFSHRSGRDLIGMATYDSPVMRKYGLVSDRIIENAQTSFPLLRTLV